MLTRISVITLVAFALVAIGGPVYTGVARMDENAIGQRVDEQPLHLIVRPVRQSEVNSCGEAAILMAYNYANPDTTLNEGLIIDYSKSMGYYTRDRFPFTSPANMVKIARNFS